MKAKKIYRRILIGLFLLSLWGIAVLSYYYVTFSKIPDSVSIYKGREEMLSFVPDSFFLPIEGNIEAVEQDVEEEITEETEIETEKTEEGQKETKGTEAEEKETKEKKEEETEKAGTETAEKEITDKETAGNVIRSREKNEDGLEETEEFQDEESLTVSQYMGTEKLPADLLHINLQKEVSIKAEQEGNYQLKIRCFGVLLKTVDLQVLEEQSVIPCGGIVGIYGETDGVLVLGTGEVTDMNGKKQEPAYNIVRSGDYIVGIDGKEISEKEELLEFLENSDGSSVELELRRGEEAVFVEIKPVQTKQEEYKLGIWVRNDTQGIGTLTFSTEDGRFGALGHAVTDVDTGEILSLSDAGLYEAEIASIQKGEAGNPGEISGIIHLGEDYRIGEILQNTSQGIFGTLSLPLPESLKKQAVPVALKQEITTGEAQIYCQLDNDIQTYQVEIEKIDKNPENTTKGMVVHITDEELLRKTNGIIQGMSGSPIIQNGKFIGAVTHVFVNDSTRGYGIFAENMLLNLQK
jgi:stage IV sporulation protein B